MTKNNIITLNGTEYDLNKVKPEDLLFFNQAIELHNLKYRPKMIDWDEFTSFLTFAIPIILGITIYLYLKWGLQ